MPSTETITDPLKTGLEHLKDIADHAPSASDLVSTPKRKRSVKLLSLLAALAMGYLAARKTGVLKRLTER